MPRHLSGFILGSPATVALMLLLGAGVKVTSPTGSAPDRYVYYPGTEELGENDPRVLPPAGSAGAVLRAVTPRLRSA
jgi:hypothetical protein